MPYNPLFDLHDLADQKGLKVKPGEGNLQLGAIFAAIAGPYRVAHGIKKAINLTADQTAKVSVMSPASRHCRYVALFLPSNNAGPVTILVGMESQLGSNSGVPVQLLPRVGPSAGVSYSAVLLPGNELFAQSATNLRIIVAEVDF